METQPTNPFPVIEGHFKGSDMYKPFTYFRQSLDGASNQWFKMTNEFVLDSSKPIVALITGRDIVWSTQAPAHMSLEKAVGIDEWDAKIETWSGKEKHLIIYTDDLSLQSDFKNYLLRSGVVSGKIKVEGATYKGQRQELI